MLTDGGSKSDLSVYTNVLDAFANKTLSKS